MKKPVIVLLAAALVATLVSGCVSSRSGDTYSRNQTLRELTVRMGTVESVREVTMEGSQSGVGTVAGAGVGGVAGSTIGQGKGQAVGAIIGAVVGGIAGKAIENEATKKQAVEITVKLDAGNLIAVVQEGEAKEFRIGDRVRVLSGGGETRVSR